MGVSENAFSLSLPLQRRKPEIQREMTSHPLGESPHLTSTSWAPMLVPPEGSQKENGNTWRGCFKGNASREERQHLKPRKYHMDNFRNDFRC